MTTPAFGQYSHYVYILLDPMGDEVFYVGGTD